MAKTIDFGHSLNQLNEIVSKVETGNLPLEETLKQFETGVALIRHCQEALTKAEQKVSMLLDNKLTPFEDKTK